MQVVDEECAGVDSVWSEMRDRVSEGVFRACVPLQAHQLPKRLPGTAGCQGEWQYWGPDW